jgi:type IX secretion system PorP/SprF family membrane protein
MISSFKKVVRTGQVLFLSVMLGNQAQAQFEPQFTQYMFNEMFINPAYAGSREHMSMTLLYRNQWVGLEGAPTTQTFTAHTPLRNDRMGIGLSIMNEEIGVTRDLSFYGNYAYRMPTSFGFVSLGLSAGLINHTERLSDLNIREQGDESFIGTPRVTVPNAGFGTFVQGRNFYAGVSIPRMIKNTVDAGASKSENKIEMQSWHYYITGGYVQPLNETIKMKATSMVKAVSGAPLIGEFGLHALFHETFWIGAAYRTGDAWAAIAQFQINNQLRMGYSYDFTTTELRNHSSGTHEITLGYDFSFNKKKVVTPRYF